MYAELHVSEPEMKNMYMHLCVRIKSSEQTEIYVIEDTIYLSTCSQNCGSDEGTWKKRRLTTEL